MVQILDKSEIARNGDWNVGNCVLAVCHSILLHHHTSATVTGDHCHILPHLFPQGDHLTPASLGNLSYNPAPYHPLAGEHSYCTPLPPGGHFAPSLAVPLAADYFLMHKPCHYVPSPLKVIVLALSLPS